MWKLRPLVVAGVLVTSATLVACGSNTENPDSSAPTAEATRTPETTATATPSAAIASATATLPTVTPELEPTMTNVEDAVRIMNSIFFSSRELNRGSIISAGHNGNAALVPVLVEAASRTFDTDIALEIADALDRLTGERVGGDFVLVAPWYEWLGNQPDFNELPGFDAWKGSLYGGIDPAFKDFFYEGVPRTVPLWTVQWGGVAKDGIPPLEMPQVLHADVATYLLPDEPVFGVVVNGEARAYPHRIMGWHEMANDILGGKPISVVF